MNYLSIKYIAIIFLYRFTFQRAGCQFCNYSSFFYVLHFYCQSVVWCYGRYIWPIILWKSNEIGHITTKKILFLNNKHNDVEPWKSCDCRPGMWGEPLYSYEKCAMNWCPQVPIQLRLWGQALLFYCTVPFKNKFCSTSGGHSLI